MRLVNLSSFLLLFRGGITINPENTKKLHEDFPDLFELQWGFECGDGWYQLIHDLSTQVTIASPEAVVSQVKEKFGALRYYCRCNMAAHEFITKAEGESRFICEKCGEPGEIVTVNDWLYCRCKACASALGAKQHSLAYHKKHGDIP